MLKLRVSLQKLQRSVNVMVRWSKSPQKIPNPKSNPRLFQITSSKINSLFLFKSKLSTQKYKANEVEGFEQLSSLCRILVTQEKLCEASECKHCNVSPSLRLGVFVQGV